MNLHDPATERELLRIAVIARAARTMEPAESYPLGSTFRRLLNHVFVLAMAAMFLGGPQGVHLADHWRELIACLMVMAMAATGNSNLHQTAADCGMHTVIPNLPIRGESALRWVRSRYLIGHAWTVTTLCFVIAFTLSGFSITSTISVARHAVLLLAVTFATMMLVDDEWLQRLKVNRALLLVSVISAVGLFGIYIFRRHYFITGHTPEWAINGLRGLIWMFPPSWTMPGRFESGGAWLAAGWIGWGLWKWIAWPRAIGFAFDEPQDLIGAFGSCGFEDDEEDHGPMHESEASLMNEVESPAGKPGCPIALPPPLAMARAGWVDHWIGIVLGVRNRHLAAALCDPSATWTKQTNWLIVFSPVWLALAWAFMAWLPDSERKEFIVLWIWIVSIAVMTVGLLPFTNAIPRAMSSWPMGAQQMPFFAGIPVNARDLLRVSTRITVARCLVMALVGGVFFPIQWMIFEPADSHWPIVALVIAITIFWSLSRPAFISYRLRSPNLRRRGIWMVDVLAMALSVLLGVGWLLAGVVGIFATFILASLGDSSGELGWSLLLAFGGLTVSGLCARAVFEIHHWQIRRGHFDWLK